MRILRSVALVALLCTPFATQTAAAEGTGISVKVNMARILRIGTPAATVIIGNPGVADVTIQDPQTLVLTGKSYGSTNLIVLDSAGNPIADEVVQVVQAQTELLTVYQGAARQTLVCAPVCQPTIILGDDTGYTQNLVQGKGIVEQSAQQ
jgi:Flp pilus assembly secretin CpaC